VTGLAGVAGLPGATGLAWVTGLAGVAGLPVATGLAWATGLAGVTSLPVATGLAGRLVSSERLSWWRFLGDWSLLMAFFLVTGLA
jgi:hypothetical protein